MQLSVHNRVQHLGLFQFPLVDLDHTAVCITSLHSWSFLLPYANPDALLYLSNRELYFQEGPKQKRQDDRCKVAVLLEDH